MDNTNPFDRPSLKKHRKQRFWQILLPIILISILIFSFGGYFISIGGAQTRVWADISIIWIVVPLLVIFIISLAILILMIIILNQAIRKTPLLTRRIHRIFYLLERQACNMADSIIKPILWVNQTKAGISSLFKRKNRII
jgi:hypothetical protein